MEFFFAQRRAKDLQSFSTCYEQHTPQLWALILSANLPAAEAKTMLSNTLRKAWQQSYRQPTIDNHSFEWLVGLAQAEGLPASVRQPVR